MISAIVTNGKLRVGLSSLKGIIVCEVNRKKQTLSIKAEELFKRQLSAISSQQSAKAEKYINKSRRCCRFFLEAES
jgi:hypothetical protein